MRNKCVFREAKSMSDIEQFVKREQRCRKDYSPHLTLCAIFMLALGVALGVWL